MKLSCAMIVKNEAHTLHRCLSQLQDMVDEIVVVDTGSTDDSVAIAESFGAKVSHFTWCNDFSAARNFSLAQATGDWILVIDADEVPLRNYRPDIETFIAAHPDAVGKIKQLNRTEKDGAIVHSSCNLTRLFPKGLQFKGYVHEQVDTLRERLQTPIEVLHDGYLTDNKVSRNLPLLIKELERHPEDSYYLYQVGKQYAIAEVYPEAMTYFGKAIDTGSAEDNHYKVLLFDSIYAAMKSQQFELGLPIIDYCLEHYDDYAELYYYAGLFFMEAALFDMEAYGHLYEHIEACYLKALELGDPETDDGLRGAGTYLSAHNLGALYEAMGDTARAKVYYDLEKEFLV